MHPTDLAWALIDAAGARLTRVERFDIHLALGAGEVDDSLKGLLRGVARERIALPHDLVAGLRHWVDAYHHTDDELRALIALAGPGVDPVAPVVMQPRYLPIRSEYQRVRQPPEGG